MSIAIKSRRGTSAAWTAADPVLAMGELGIETDTLRFKVGDGSALWSALGYMVSDSVFDPLLTTEVKTDTIAPTDLTLTTGAERTLLLASTVYDDLQVSISNIKLPPANQPADRLWAFGIVGGIEFPVLGFDLNEYIYFTLQTSHSMKLETVLDNHIHYSLPNTTTIGHAFRFRLDVAAAGVDGTWAVPTGSPYFKETLVAADDNTKHRLSDNADIPGVNTTVSTVYHCKLTRVAVVAPATEYTSEVYVAFIDSHYQKDTIGSRIEYGK